jgi:hypothetical protein
MKWRNRLLLLKPESTYGTAPSMTGADAILCPEIDVTPLEVELKDRELIVGYYGNTEKVLTMQMSKAVVTVELAGSGSPGVAPKWGPLHRACSYAQTIVASTSVRYDPVSSAQESVAMQFWADGIQHTLRGAQGTWSLSGDVGEIPKLKYEMMALYTTAVDGTRPSGTFTSQAKPKAFNSRNTPNVSIHGFAACLESLSLDIANEVIFRQLAGCSELVQINDRKPSGSLKIEAPSLAAKDYFAAVEAQDLGEVNVTHGTEAGNIIEIIQPSCNLGSIGYSESNGILMLDMTYMPNPDSGNDEVSLLLT